MAETLQALLPAAKMARNVPLDGWASVTLTWVANLLRDAADFFEHSLFEGGGAEHPDKFKHNMLELADMLEANAGKNLTASQVQQQLNKEDPDHILVPAAEVIFLVRNVLLREELDSKAVEILNGTARILRYLAETSPKFVPIARVLEDIPTLQMTPHDLLVRGAQLVDELGYYSSERLTNESKMFDRVEADEASGSERLMNNASSVLNDKVPHAVIELFENATKWLESFKVTVSQFFDVKLPQAHEKYGQAVVKSISGNRDFTEHVVRLIGVVADHSLEGFQLILKNIRETSEKVLELMRWTLCHLRVASEARPECGGILASQPEMSKIINKEMFIDFAKRSTSNIKAAAAPFVLQKTQRAVLLQGDESEMLGEEQGSLIRDLLEDVA
jgi:hypothetical protein